LANNSALLKDSSWVNYLTFDTLTLIGTGSTVVSAYQYDTKFPFKFVGYKVHSDTLKDATINISTNVKFK